MAVATYEKRAIALAQLETALRLFEGQSDYFSVVTLAGATDEIFGRLLEEIGKEPFVKALAKGAAELYMLMVGTDVGARAFVDRANRARNDFKHHSPGQSQSVSLDPREEAIDMLDRAVTDYWRLEATMTPAMKKFVDGQRFA